MSFRYVWIIWNDPERPTTTYHHEKSVREYNDESPFELIAVHNDACLYRNKAVYERMINKSFGSPPFWFYEDHDPLFHYYPYDQPHGTFTCYISLPYPFPEGEQFPDLDTQADTYGRYGLYPWEHIEAFDDVFIQGVLLTRDTDVGDNIRRIYLNGESWLADIAAAVEKPEADILGIAFIPCTDRLNSIE